MFYRYKADIKSDGVENLFDQSQTDTSKNSNR
jgi:hypothetical protein